MKKIGDWYFTDNEQEDGNPMFYFASENAIGSNGWQEHYVDYLLDFIPVNRRNTCIDVGASYGFLSTGFAKIYKNVFSFEINSEVNECLKKNISNFNNIKLMNVGLSDKESIVDLNINSDITGSASIEYHPEGYHSIKEKVITLDSLNLSNIDMIKIDVEGHEYAVLKGSVETIKKYSPMLLIELFTYRNKVHDQNRKQCINFLRNLGYEILDVRNHDFIFQKS